MRMSLGDGLAVELHLTERTFRRLIADGWDGRADTWFAAFIADVARYGVDPSRVVVTGAEGLAE